MKRADKKTIESTIAFLIANIPRLNKATETEIEALLDNAYRENNPDRAILQLLFVLLTLQRRGKQLSVPLPEEFQKLVESRAQARLKEMSPASRALLNQRIRNLTKQSGGTVDQCGGDPLTIGLVIGGAVLGLSLIVGIYIFVTKRQKSRMVPDSPISSPEVSPRTWMDTPPPDRPAPVRPVRSVIGSEVYGLLPPAPPVSPVYGLLPPAPPLPPAPSVYGRVPRGPQPDRF